MNPFALNVFVVYLLTAVTGKFGLGIKGSCLQTCRHGQRLENRTRLEGIRDAEIAPHFIQRVHHLVVCHAFLLAGRVVIRQIPGIVQIVPVIGIHSQNFSGVGIHDNHANILRPVCLVLVRGHFIVKILYGVPDNLLDINVDGGNHISALRGGDNGLFHIRVHVVVPVLPAAGSVQDIRIISLDSPVRSGSVIGKPNQVAGL